MGEDQGRGRPRADETDIGRGEQIRARRQEVGLTQQKLAEALGVSFQQLQKYEKGSNRVAASRLQQIAAALNVPVSHFYGAAENEPKLEQGGVTDGASTNGARRRTDPRLVREGRDLLRAFLQIKDPLMRQRIVELAQTMALHV